MASADGKDGSPGTKLEFGAPHAATEPSNPPPAPAPHVLPPHVGRFVVESQLGEGGMGSVLLATDVALGRRVAIKVLRAGTSSDDARRRLLREAQGTAQLVHENVIVVHEVGTHEGQVYIAMEYVAGRTLRAWQAGRGPEEIIAMYVRAGRGLQVAHDAKLVHRDFKPDNVLVGDDGRVRVTDFGLVAAVDAAPEHRALDATRPPALELDSKLTKTGALMGTPRYMAPEQHRGQPVDARGDQFSFCVALYEALHRELPFEGDAYAELAANVTAGTRRAAPVDHGVPAHVSAAIDRGLRVDRDARFGSMRELLAAISSPPASVAPVSRKRAWMIGAGLLAVVGIGAGYAAWPASDRAVRTTPVAAAPSPSDAETRALLQTAMAAFDAGGAAYVGGQFSEAVARFQDAYRARPYAPFLFDAAIALEKAGRAANDPGAERTASALYQRYLAEDPQARDRTAVLHVIAALETEAARPATDRSAHAPIAEPTLEDLHGVTIIISAPTNAEIWADDMKVPLGLTPWGGWLEGPHRFVVRKPGHVDSETSADVDPHKMFVLSLQLKPRA